MAKGAKHDPFFTHLWDELLGAKLLQNETVAKWMDLPAKLQTDFAEAAKRAMNTALGVPAKKRPARKSAKKAARPKAKAKTKAESKGKAKPKARAKA